MGLEKERKIERDDNRRKLSSVLKTSSKLILDFSAGTLNDSARVGLSGVFLDLVSAIADGDVNYITVGQSRDGNAVLLTVTDHRSVKSYAGGHDWDKFARECAGLFVQE